MRRLHREGLFTGNRRENKICTRLVFPETGEEVLCMKIKSVLCDLC